MEKVKLTRDEYIRLMEGCLAAWNRADAEAVASFYSDTLDYRDPTVPGGISNKKDFIGYLKLIFRVWPEQQWVPKTIMQHADEGAFTIDYTFRIGNGKKSIGGNGMDRMEFEGDKVRLNHVYLNADKWKDWIKNELKEG